MECDIFDLGCHVGWVINEIKLLFVSFSDQIIGGVASVFEAIPAPDFLLNITNYGLPSGVLYYTTLFQVPFGLGVMVSAYTARFILRRIPIIG